MSIRKNLRKWLTEQTEVSELVGSRVWPIKRPGGDADTLPCLVLVKTKSRHGADLSAQNNDQDHVFHLIAVGDEYSQVDAIYEALAGESGIINGKYGLSMNGQSVRGTTIEDDFDHAEYDVLNGEALTYMITVVAVISTGDGG